MNTYRVTIFSNVVGFLRTASLDVQGPQLGVVERMLSTSKHSYVIEIV